MIWRWLRRLFTLLIAIVLAAAGLVLWRSNAEPLSPEQVSRFTIGLNEAAAIGVPHGFLMDDDLRQPHAALLVRVEAGDVLTLEDSAAYRAVYQQVLARSQRFLGAFDDELTVLPDHGMGSTNNIAGHGIAGQHDHHDESARRNFDGLLQSLHNLEQATSSWQRIRSANAAQKDLVDLISHLGVAPHTVSVVLEPSPAPWSDPDLGAMFEGMLRAYKQAQFAAVHSPAYWAAVDDALEQYNRLILAVQDRVVARTTAWERRVAGRFLALQTLAPPVDLNRPLRRK